MNSDTEVVIVGGGAARIAAGRRLCGAGIACLIVEARARLGGRAWTVSDREGHALDLGCGWLHSADCNPWRKIAQAQGRTIDQTPPPWTRVSLPALFPLIEQHEMLGALQTFYARVGAVPEGEPDRPAAALLAAHDPWNNLINAVSTYVSGVELDRVSLHDFGRYDDTGVNWRVVEGYGTTVAAHGSGLLVALDCAVQRIDHGGKRLKIETAKGAITADKAIVTLPSAALAQERVVFAPALPEKVEAAARLPLGLADKLFLSLDDADEFEADSRLFGHTDRIATGFYHFRPFGRPQIEAYLGGRLAADLEASGAGAFFDFVVSELTGLLGHTFARRVKPIHLHRWGADPFARGSYSYALPGAADGRAALAAPVDGRLFFAGEACSRSQFSTAHGAWTTGVDAADQVIAARAARQ